jgi:hypothetical protein
MKVDHVWMRLFEKPIKITHAVWQMTANVRLHSEAVCPHLFAKRAQGRHRVYARIMTLIALETAHLRHKSFGSANLHAVDYMRDSNQELEPPAARL